MLRDIFEHSTSLYYSHTPEHDITFFNPQWKAFFGYEPDENIDKWTETLTDHPVNKKGIQETQRAIDTGKPQPSYELQLQRKNGETFWVEVNEAPVVKNGKTVSIAGSLTDITKRKQAEDVLKFQAKLLDQVGEAVMATDLEGMITYWNKAAEKIYGWSKEEVMGKNILEVTPTSQNREQASEIMDVLTKGEEWSGEFTVQRKDGSTFPAYVIDSPIFGENGDIIGVIGVSNDITKQKKNEEFIRKNLKEKEVLLSEIHHRVKNNMAVISSLLDLQIEFDYTKRNTETLLKDMRNRIKSIALVYEMVYEDENIVEINFSELLHRLVEQLKVTHRQENKDISVHINAEEVIIDMNTSVPLSLLVNEAISNAFKHAFSRRKGGCIEVNLVNTKKGYRFVVQDDGTGVSDIDQLTHPATFGCTIIQGLTRQLQGELSWQSLDRGLKVEVWFPKRNGSAKAKEANSVLPDE